MSSASYPHTAGVRGSNPRKGENINSDYSLRSVLCDSHSRTKLSGPHGGLLCPKILALFKTIQYFSHLVLFGLISNQFFLNL